MLSLWVREILFLRVLCVFFKIEGLLFKIRTGNIRNTTKTKLLNGLSFINVKKQTQLLFLKPGGCFVNHNRAFKKKAMKCY